MSARPLIVVAFGSEVAIPEGSWSLVTRTGGDTVRLRDLGHTTKECATQAARCELQHVAHDDLILFGPDGFRVRVPKPRKVRP